MANRQLNKQNKLTIFYDNGKKVNYKERINIYLKKKEEKTTNSYYNYYYEFFQFQYL